MTEEDTVVNEQEGMEDTEEQIELSDEEKAQAKLKEAVDVKVEEVGPLRKKLTITVPREIIDERLSEQYDELKREAAVPGFRKGHAPLRLIEKRFGNEVGDQITAALVSGAYTAATEKEDIDVLGEPYVYVTVKEQRTEDGKKTTVDVEKLLDAEEAIDKMELPDEGPFSYVCEVDVKPEFELPKLEKIPVERPKIEVSDEDVEAEIKRMMAMRGTYKPVEDGAVEIDDILVGNFALKVDGKDVKTEENAQIAARDQRYDGLTLEGFGEAAKGKKSGDKVTIKIVIPDDYTVTELRSKDAEVSLEILDIKRLEVPELTEESITAMGFDDEKELREYIKEAMEGQLADLLKQGMHGQITDFLLENTDFEVPSGLSQRQTDQIVAQRMMELYSQGLPDAEIGKQIDELRLKAAEEAKQDLKRFFIMEKISAERDVTVSEEELNSAIAGIAQRRGRRFDRVRDEIISSNQLSALYLRLRNAKILGMLLEEAEVTEKDVPKKKATKKTKSAKSKKAEQKE